jgi:hypothetical protein
MKLPNALHSPRQLFIIAAVLYGLALVQNILLPLGSPNIILTGLLSFAGSLALIAGIMMPRLKLANKQSNKAK